MAAPCADPRESRKTEGMARATSANILARSRRTAEKHGYERLMPPSRYCARNRVARGDTDHLDQHHQCLCESLRAGAWWKDGLLWTRLGQPALDTATDYHRKDLFGARTISIRRYNSTPNIIQASGRKRDETGPKPIQKFTVFPSRFFVTTCPAP